MTTRSNGTLLTSRGVVLGRQITPSLPAAPAGLSQQQLKRRHIVAAIVHSENSYVATLQRLVNVRFYFFCFFIISYFYLLLSSFSFWIYFST